MRVKRVKYLVWILAIGLILLTPLKWSLKFKDRLLGLICCQSEKQTLDPNLKIENYLLKKELQKFRLSESKKTVCANIIYRDPLSWSSFAWIDVGSKDQIPFLKKNAPVVVDDVLVGIIDHVEATCSKVRLITDPKLHPSVQIHRGSQKVFDVKQTARLFQNQLRYYKELPLSDQEKQQWEKQLSSLLEKLDPQEHYERLSMGFLSGMATSFWSTQRPYLKGSGFAYHDETRTFLLVDVGDLLVTSGLDGIFPPGLKVAYVTKVYPQKEGDYVAHIEGEPLLYLDKANVVTVIPSVVEGKESF